MSKPILCLDFDGVAHKYTSGWKGATVIPDDPVDGLFDFLEEACEHFDVCILSSRSHQEGGIDAMRDWFIKHCPEDFEISQLPRFVTEKPPALVSIDDRCLLFEGKWPSIEDLKNFKPWYLRQIQSGKMPDTKDFNTVATSPSVHEVVRKAIKDLAGDEGVTLSIESAMAVVTEWDAERQSHDAEVRRIADKIGLKWPCTVEDICNEIAACKLRA
jgi:hypothetical protein